MADLGRRRAGGPQAIQIAPGPGGVQRDRLISPPPRFCARAVTLTSALTFALGATPPLIVVLLAPLNGLIMWVCVIALAGLMGLGALGATAGGADVTRSVLRVAFWGAIAMAATAGIGRLFGTIV